MTNTTALNAKRPETETVELETSRVPENLIVPEEVSPPVATAEEVPCQPSSSAKMLQHTGLCIISPT